MFGNERNGGGGGNFFIFFMNYSSTGGGMVVNTTVFTHYKLKWQVPILTLDYRVRPAILLSLYVVACLHRCARTHTHTPVADCQERYE